MWLCDLEKALGKVIAFLGADACMVCVDKVTPCWDGGIVFALSDGRFVRWKPDDTITVKEKGDWRK